MKISLLESSVAKRGRQRLFFIRKRGVVAHHLKTTARSTASTPLEWVSSGEARIDAALNEAEERILSEILGWAVRG